MAFDLFIYHFNGHGETTLAVGFATNGDTTDTWVVHAGIERCLSAIDADLCAVTTQI